MSKKDAILIAALELLVEKGVHNTPMSAIAKAAGTGMGTIYNYFPNKDSLINAIYINIKEQEEAVFLKVDTNDAIKTQFEHYLTIIIEFFIKNPSYFLFMEQLQASPIITKESKMNRGKSVELVAILLKKGQADGIIKNINIEALLVFIGGTISSYLRWCLNKNAHEHTALSQHVKMAWDAIKQ